MTTQNFSPLLDEVRELTDQFLNADRTLYLVGGIVRDLFANEKVTSKMDLDFTTDALPDEIKKIVAPVADNLWLSGEKFGTIGIQHNGRIYEITTHRAESYDIDSRKPQVSYSKDINEDLSRRDFTINAMAISLPDGTLIDPFNGQHDLKEGLLRTPLTPQESFSDDPLRMMRAARFMAGYNLIPAPELINAMHDLAERFNIVSAERILGELDKLLQVQFPEKGFLLLHDTGILRLFLPEISSKRFQYLSEITADATLRMAALLAEMAPPESKKRLRELRYSKERSSAIQQIIDGAITIFQDPSSDSNYRRWYHQIGEYREQSFQIALTLNEEARQIWAKMEETRTQLGSELDDFSLPITGDEIIKLLLIEEGPIVGEALQYLQHQRFEYGQISNSEAQKMLQDWWAAKSNQPSDVD